VSGLNQRFTKPPFLNWNREFESRSFRHSRGRWLNAINIGII